MRTLNLALIGAKVIGKAHSNAWLQVSQFFNPGIHQGGLGCHTGASRLRVGEVSFGYFRALSTIIGSHFFPSYHGRGNKGALPWVHEFRE